MRDSVESSMYKEGHRSDLEQDYVVQKTQSSLICFEKVSFRLDKFLVVGLVFSWLACFVELLVIWRLCDSFSEFISVGFPLFRTLCPLLQTAVVFYGVNLAVRPAIYIGLILSYVTVGWAGFQFSVIPELATGMVFEKILYIVALVGLLWYIIEYHRFLKTG